jgi:hypothetical protein
MKYQSSDPFDHRRRALEDEFFYQRDQQLVSNLRNEFEALEERHKLAHVSGIVDQKVLLDLVHAGVTGESLLATRMIPMVIVAWSDHIITAEERAAILNSAANDKIVPGSAAYKLLTHWLHERPRAEVVNAWREYAQELVKVASPEVVQELRARTSRLCHQVALASNGFWSLGRIPPAKQQIIDEFIQAWDSQRV